MSGDILSIDLWEITPFGKASHVRPKPNEFAAPSKANIMELWCKVSADLIAALLVLLSKNIGPHRH